MQLQLDQVYICISKYIVSSLTHLTYQPIYSGACRVTCSRGSAEGNTNAVTQSFKSRYDLFLKERNTLCTQGSMILINCLK